MKISSFSIHWKIITIIYILSVSTQTIDYYGSQNEISWYNAEDFCNNHCKSYLISLHSSTKDIELQAFCLEMSNDESGDCWIGLTDESIEDTFTWTDGSTFDYAAWGDEEPNNLNNNQDCVQLRSAGTPAYSWGDADCTYAKHFICNECSLTLSKYILVSSSLVQANANQYCRDTFGTELATIQSENDFQEAKLLCNYTGGNCIIGLYDYNTDGDWEWEDGTQNLDFWTNSNGSVSGYPWYSTEPNGAGNENCVQLQSAYSYLANDVRCSGANMFLCNSALDNYICDINVQRGLWSDLSCIWTWNSMSDGCGVTLSDVTEDCTTWMVNSSTNGAYQSWGDLVIEVTLAITDSTYIGSKAGFIIRAENASPLKNSGQQYFIALDLSANTIDFIKIDDGWSMISTFALDFNANVGTYYNIRCEIIGHAFKIYVDNALYITINDYSYNHGSVGLRSWNQTSIYKKLFVSGLEFVPSQSPTNFPSYDPTVQPSQYPSSVPTYNPSFNPTVQPSKNPSMIPTQPPTAVPIIDPTYYPTNDPSYEPTNVPSSVTDEPTKDPTEQPSTFPTVQPSIHPVENPTSEPTSEPTLDPTSVKTSANSEGFLDFNSDNFLILIVVIVSVIVLLIGAFAVHLVKKKAMNKKQSTMVTAGGFTPGNTSKPVHEGAFKMDVNVADTQLSQVQMMHLNMNQNMTAMGDVNTNDTRQLVYTDAKRWHIPLNTNINAIAEVQSVKPVTPGKSDFDSETENEESLTMDIFLETGKPKPANDFGMVVNTQGGKYSR